MANLVSTPCSLFSQGYQGFPEGPPPREPLRQGDGALLLLLLSIMMLLLLANAAHLESLP